MQYPFCYIHFQTDFEEITTVPRKQTVLNCKDGWLIRLLQHFEHANMAISYLNSLKSICKANGVYKRNYSFMMNIMEEIFEIRSWIEILANGIKIDTTEFYTDICSTVNKELQGIQNKRFSSFKTQEWECLIFIGSLEAIK